MATDAHDYTTEQKARAITVRPVGQQLAADGDISEFFKDIPPTPKQGQPPIADYFKDVGIPETGPVDPKAVVPPRNAQLDPFKPEADVDYETGAPMGHRMNLYRASGDKGPSGMSEQERYLRNEFGPGNYRQDAGGNWLVKPNWEKFRDRSAGAQPSGPAPRHDPATSKWTAVWPRGAAASMENAGVMLASPALTMGGAVAGAAAGTAMGGIPGGVAGAGVGGGAGHLVDEGFKALQGFYDKTPGQLGKDTALEMGVNAAFQGAGPAWNASKNALYNTTSRALQRFSGVTPVTRALTQGLDARYGVTPPMRSIAPNAKALEYDRVQRNRTSGDPMEERRRAVVASRIDDILTSTGMSPQQQVLARQYVYNTDVASSGRTGEMVRDAITARNEASQQLQDAYVEDAHRALDRAVAAYKTNITTDPGKKGAMRSAGDTARAVAKDVEGERETFGREMNDVATNMHNAANGAPVVDIAATIPLVDDFLHPTPGPMRKILEKAGRRDGQNADDMAAVLPDDVAPNVAADDIKSIMEAIAARVRGETPPGMAAPANENGPVMVTIEEAHKLRSSLMEMVRFAGDTSPIGVRRSEVYQIVKAIDNAMDQVGLEAGGNLGQAMRDFNRQWAEGIVRFTNDDINAVLRQTRAGRPPDPGVVADAIYNRKSLTAVKQIYDMLTPETQFMVQTARLHNIIRDATVPVGKFGRPTLDPDAVIEALHESASADRYIFGRNNAILKQLEDLAVAFKASKGQVELDSLPVGGNVVPFGRSPVGVSRGTTDILRSLNAARDEQNAIRREVEQDVAAALRSNDPKLVDGGVRYILGSEARTLRAAEVLGAGSPEWEMLRREAKVELLRSAIVPTTTGMGRTVSASGLAGALGSLTARQQAMLLPGAELDDFRLLASQAKMLFPDLVQDPGGSLAAAATLGNLPKANAIRRWTWSQVAGYIADSPAVARMLAGTIRQDPYTGRRMLGYLMQYGANVGMSANPTQPIEGAGVEPSFEDKMRQLEAVHKPVPKGYGGPQL